MKRKSFFIIIIVLIFSINNIQAQTDGDIGTQEMNVITTAVPFLTITPDSRAGAMGDVGAATTPDVNSLHWNPAKYAFTDRDFGVALSYSPWLHKLASDMSLNNLSAYKRINERQTVALSLTYFTIGEIQFTNNLGQELYAFNPNEFSINSAYALKLGENFSGAVALRFIYSNLTGGISLAGVGETHPGIAVGGDLAFFYTKELDIKDKKNNLAIGLNISNLGSKISYGATVESFIPSNFKIGTAWTTNLDDYNSLMFAFDINKMLVPTPPIYDGDGYGEDHIVAGYPTDISTSYAVIRSFYDAPWGAKEELHELMYSAGIEYWYAKKFAVRAGYFHEHKYKGNRKYFTTGIGLRLNVFSLDFSYLIPVNNNHHPLEGTLKFTLGFNFGDVK